MIGKLREHSSELQYMHGITVHESNRLFVIENNRRLSCVTCLQLKPAARNDFRHDGYNAQEYKARNNRKDATLHITEN